MGGSSKQGASIPHRCPVNGAQPESPRKQRSERARKMPEGNPQWSSLRTGSKKAPQERDVVRALREDKDRSGYHFSVRKPAVPRP